MVVSDWAQVLRDSNKAGAAWKHIAIHFRHVKQGERFAQAIGRASVPHDLLQGNRYTPANDSLKILSKDSSKGLEFPVVFLPCLDAMPAPGQ